MSRNITENLFETGRPKYTKEQMTEIRGWIKSSEEQARQDALANPDPVVMELVELVDSYCEGPVLKAIPFAVFRVKYRDIISRLPERYKK